MIRGRTGMEYGRELGGVNSMNKMMRLTVEFSMSVTLLRI
jgi:hypothetical protein